MTRMLEQGMSRKRQRGSVAVLTGLALLVLLGMLGLVLDLGHLYITKTELQNAADACALAAAGELSAFNASTMDRATQAGIAAGSDNKVNLQAAAADIRDADITFGADLAVDANGKLLHFERKVGPATVYARCAPHEANRLSVAMWVMQIFGSASQDMYADAVAKQPPVKNYCALPIAVCTTEPQSGPGGTTPPPWGFSEGTWYKGRLESGTAVQGNYGWVRFPNQETGTASLSDMIAGKGMCELDTTDKVYQNRGISNGAAKAWNTRFGLYGSPYRKDPPNLVDHPPDKTGWAYQNWVEGGVFKNFQSQQLKHEPYDPMNMVDGKGVPIDYPGTPSPLTREQHTSYGQERRVVAMPVIQCSEWDRNDDKKAMNIVGWACSLMVAPMEDAQAEVQLEFRAPIGAGDCAGARSNAGFPKLVR